MADPKGLPGHENMDRLCEEARTLGCAPEQVNTESGGIVEYKRTVNGNGTFYQWVDSEMVMVIDTVTGAPQRFSGNATGHIDDALSYVELMPGWETRLAIVRIPCIRAFVCGQQASEERTSPNRTAVFHEDCGQCLSERTEGKASCSHCGKVFLAVKAPAPPAPSCVWRSGCRNPIICSAEARCTQASGAELCSDCPPVGYPTDKTRCEPCPRRAEANAEAHLERDKERRHNPTPHPPSGSQED